MNDTIADGRRHAYNVVDSKQLWVEGMSVASRLQSTALAFAALFACTLLWAAEQPIVQPSIEVHFSPDGGCTHAIVKALGEAKTRIRIQAHSFTSKAIAQVILHARKRGVKIEAVLDKNNETSKYTAATFLANQGVAVLIDSEHAIAHNKIILIDEAVIITGSFNFTNAAESKNAENLLIIRNAPELFAKYLANFEAHRKHSMPYVRTKIETDGN